MPCVAIEFSDPAIVRPGFDRLAELMSDGLVRLVDLEFIHSIDGVASTVAAGRVDARLAQFSSAVTGTLNRDDLDTVAVGLPHACTAAVLLYEGESMAEVLAAWTTAGASVMRYPLSS